MPKKAITPVMEVDGRTSLSKREAAAEAITVEQCIIKI